MSAVTLRQKLDALKEKKQITGVPKVPASSVKEKQGKDQIASPNPTHAPTDAVSATSSALIAPDVKEKTDTKAAAVVSNENDAKKAEKEAETQKKVQPIFKSSSVPTDYHIPAHRNIRRATGADFTRRLFHSLQLNLQKNPPSKRGRSSSQDRSTKNEPNSSNRNDRTHSKDVFGFVSDKLGDNMWTLDVNQFKCEHRISEGVYGVVYKSTHISTKKPYALKWIKSNWFDESRVGFPAYLLREIDFVTRIKHPHIMTADGIAMSMNNSPNAACSSKESDGGTTETSIRKNSIKIKVVVLDDVSNQKPSVTQQTVNPFLPKNVDSVTMSVGFPVIGTPSQRLGDCMKYKAPPTLKRQKLFVVMEFAGNNLRNEIYRPEPMGLYGIMHLSRQLLDGLAFLHKHHIMHRDLKPSNILVDDSFTAKICDLGLARPIWHAQPRDQTVDVVTLMYRAPELHFEIDDYSSAVDAWSVGCIIAEMLLGREPLFRAQSDAEHLSEICNVVGVPTDTTFPGFTQTKGARKLLGVRVDPEACEAHSRQGELPWRLKAVMARRIRLPRESCHGNASPSHTIQPLSIESIDVDLAAVFALAEIPVVKELLDLIDGFIKWNPKDRRTCAEGLEHPIFSDFPAATKKSVSQLAERKKKHLEERAKRHAAAKEAASRASLKQNAASSSTADTCARPDGDTKASEFEESSNIPSGAPSRSGEREADGHVQVNQGHGVEYCDEAEETIA